jgi:outer membrane lipoprotein-sorting protein
MLVNWRRVAGIFIFILLLAVSVHGEVDLGTIKKNVRQTLFKTNYYGEYTVTTFRFGRRLEEIYQIWAKDGGHTRQAIAPIWQQGELIIESKNIYTYYIPTQNAGLKITMDKPRNRFFQDLGITLDKFTLVDEGTTLLNRETFILAGENNKEKYRLWISKSDYFPLQMEIYRQGLLVRSFKFNQLKELPTAFNSNSLISNQVTWYYNENAFWRAISIPRLQPGVSFQIIQPTYLPEGFAFKRATLEELSIATVVYLIYENSDHQFISLFEREKVFDQQKFNPENLKRLPILNARGHSIYVYQWVKDRVQLALIGPVPQEELKKMAASVK